MGSFSPFPTQPVSNSVVTLTANSIVLNNDGKETTLPVVRDAMTRITSFTDGVKTLSITYNT